MNPLMKWLTTRSPQQAFLVINRISLIIAVAITVLGITSYGIRLYLHWSADDAAAAAYQQQFRDYSKAAAAYR